MLTVGGLHVWIHDCSDRITTPLAVLHVRNEGNLLHMCHIGEMSVSVALY